MRAASDVEDFGGGPGEFFEKVRNPEHEDAGVPEKAARGGSEKLFRARARRLLHEPHDPPAGSFFSPLPILRNPSFSFFSSLFSRNFFLFYLHVPETGLGSRRRNPERDERIVRPRRRCRRVERGEERRLVAHGLVGRQHCENGVGCVLRGRQRRKGDRGRGVAAHGLENEARARDFRKFGDEERLVRRAPRDEDVPGSGERGPAPPGLPKQRLASGQREEGLRPAVGRARPQPRAASAGEDERAESSGARHPGDCTEVRDRRSSRRPAFRLRPSSSRRS